MPRYIDADAYEQKLADKNIFFPALFKNELDDMPTADVVPKSEVERLQAEAECLRNANADLALALLYECEPTKELLSELEKTVREKVAREIFEEIEELAKIYTFPVVKNGVVEIVKEPFWCIEPSDLAELKKKYIPAEAQESKAEDNEFFTPEEVRKMSQAEVRQNYAKIINSMSKWHEEHG